jgi:integrase
MSLPPLTYGQAFSALLFLYREVLKVEFDAPLDSVRAKKPARLPVVLTRAEAQQVLEGMTGTYQLMAKLLYGSGLRLMECVRLRVKDIDFERREITVRDAKGGHERVTMLPESLIAPLQEHLKRVKLLHEQDLDVGFGQVYLPYALDRKFPSASREWSKRQYVFPSDRLSTDPRSGLKRRHHVDESSLQRAVKACPE